MEQKFLLIYFMGEKKIEDKTERKNERGSKLYQISVIAVCL